MIKDSFAEQIKSIPAFNSLHKGYQDNFNQGNFYVQRFMPPEKVVVWYFAEFVHDDAIREDVTEVIRFIFREFHQC